MATATPGAKLAMEQEVPDNKIMSVHRRAAATDMMVSTPRWIDAPTRNTVAFKSGDWGKPEIGARFLGAQGNKIRHAQPQRGSPSGIKML